METRRKEVVKISQASSTKSFTAKEARRVGTEIGIDWESAPFDVEQFRTGMDVELEHGLRDRTTNVTDDNSVVTGKIALAHLRELPDYAAVPLVAVTGFTMYDDRERARASGFDDFLTKPISPADLLNAVKRLCG